MDARSSVPNERQAPESIRARVGTFGAIELYAANPARIRAVVLDMTMPRMGGEEAFKRMRELSADVRVVLTSGYNEQEATSHFVGRGYAAFLQKPFLPRDLLEQLEEILSD